MTTKTTFRPAEFTNTSIISGRTATVTIFKLSQPEFDRLYAEWQRGGLIQNVFNMLNADEREFIKTGITPQEWDEMFSDGEEDE
jgi:hypothetical protein